MDNNNNYNNFDADNVGADNGSLNSEIGAYNSQNGYNASETPAPAPEMPYAETPTPDAVPDNTDAPYATPTDMGYMPEPAKKSTGFALASLILGIVSLLCCCFGVPIVPSALSIVFAFVDKSKVGKMSGMGIAGIICSAIALVLGIVGTVISFAMMLADPSFMNDLFGL